MSDPTLSYVSRRLASGAVIAYGDATARDIALWLSGLSVAATAPVPGATSPVDGLMATRMTHANVPMRSLMALAGVDRLALLRPSIIRLQGTQIRLMSMADEQVQACIGWEAMNEGQGEEHEAGQATLYREPAFTVETAALFYPGLLAAEAHVDNDVSARVPVEPVAFRLATLARMRSRYSPLLYLRALAWLRGPVPLRAGWKKRFVGVGRVEMRVPMPDAELLIGVPAYKTRHDYDRYALAPAKADLAMAGINMHVEWETLPGYARVVSHLSLTMSLSTAPVRAARPKPVRKVKLTPRVPMLDI